VKSDNHYDRMETTSNSQHKLVLYKTKNLKLSQSW